MPTADLGEFETCFNKKRIHNGRDVSQAFEALVSAPYAGVGSSRFTCRSALLRLSALPQVQP
jgi:hypothetical protein